MKINPVMLIISFAAAALAAYGFYSADAGEANRLLLTIGSGVLLFITLCGATGATAEARGATLNIRIVSGLFFVLFLISNLVFAFTRTVTAPYIIVNGILLVLYVLIAYAVAKALGK